MKFKKIELPIISFYIIIIFLSVFFILSLSLLKTNKNLESDTEKKNLISRQQDYKLISPLLDCADETVPYIQTKILKNKINQLVEGHIEKSNINEVSVYFRDLNNGPWISYNSEEKFSPASLMKVPILIAYLKKAETDKSFLNEKINSGSIDNINKTQQNVKPRLEIKENTSYSVIELLESLIIYSDNNAADILLKNLRFYELDYVFFDLGLDFLAWETGENFLTVRDYSSFFRILYNASYLNREMSELALSILTKSEYDAGIKAGISDKNIVVAHKFGERVLVDSKQLHDCGIIYNYEKPYLLCIMTRGEDFLVMKDVIKEISEVFYQDLKIK